MRRAFFAADQPKVALVWTETLLSWYIFKKHKKITLGEKDGKRIHGMARRN